jgi:hypothetical protein
MQNGLTTLPVLFGVYLRSSRSGPLHKPDAVEGGHYRAAFFAEPPDGTYIWLCRACFKRVRAQFGWHSPRNVRATNSHLTIVNARRRFGPKRKIVKSSSNDAARSIPSRRITAKLVRSTTEKSWSR